MPFAYSFPRAHLSCLWAKKLVFGLFFWPTTASDTTNVILKATIRSSCAYSSLRPILIVCNVLALMKFPLSSLIVQQYLNFLFIFRIVGISWILIVWIIFTSANLFIDLSRTSLQAIDRFFSESGLFPIRTFFGWREVNFKVIDAYLSIFGWAFASILPSHKGPSSAFPSTILSTAIVIPWLTF